MSSPAHHVGAAITDAGPLLGTRVREWLCGAPSLSRDAGVVGEAGAPFDVLDPGTGRVLTSLASASADEVDVAVRAARRAADDGRWADLDAQLRYAAMTRLAALIERDFDLLSTIEAIDSGKPLADAVLDVQDAIDVLRYYAGWCDKITGLTIAAPRRYAAATVRGPVGVCAAITPWNYPLPLLVWKLAPALACGNVFLGKPSELAPLSALHLARLCLEAGIPEDVVTILPGAAVTGAALASHGGVDKISFTGSTRTGRAIMRAASERPARVTLELGGKSPHVVFASADLERAAASVAAGIWTNAGQVCVAGSRLLVQRDVHDEFIALLAAQTRRVVLGHALEPRSTVGPMISEPQRAKADEVVARAVRDGATPVTGGSAIEGPGFFFEPTILTGLPTEHAVSQEEVFGPVLVVDVFDTEEDAVRKGNDTAYGLAAGVWTGQAGQGMRMARSLSAGTVWVNTYGVFHPTLPFGGTKSSGFGRELGAAAIDAYTETTTVIEDLGV